jgi:hypothetical protein
LPFCVIHVFLGSVTARGGRGFPITGNGPPDML